MLLYIYSNCKDTNFFRIGEILSAKMFQRESPLPFLADDGNIKCRMAATPVL